MDHSLIQLDDNRECLSVMIPCQLPRVFIRDPADAPEPMAVAALPGLCGGRKPVAHLGRFRAGV